MASNACWPMLPYIPAVMFFSDTSSIWRPHARAPMQSRARPPGDREAFAEMSRHSSPQMKPRFSGHQNPQISWIQVGACVCNTRKHVFQNTGMGREGSICSRVYLPVTTYLCIYIYIYHGHTSKNGVTMSVACCILVYNE